MAGRARLLRLPPGLRRRAASRAASARRGRSPSRSPSTPRCRCSRCSRGGCPGGRAVEASAARRARRAVAGVAARRRAGRRSDRRRLLPAARGAARRSSTSSRPGWRWPCSALAAPGRSRAPPPGRRWAAAFAAFALLALWRPGPDAVGARGSRAPARRRSPDCSRPRCSARRGRAAGASAGVAAPRLDRTRLLRHLPVASRRAARARGHGRARRRDRRGRGWRSRSRSAPRAGTSSSATRSAPVIALPLRPRTAPAPGPAGRRASTHERGADRRRGGRCSPGRRCWPSRSGGFFATARLWAALVACPARRGRGASSRRSRCRARRRAGSRVAGLAGLLGWTLVSRALGAAGWAW